MRCADRGWSICDTITTALTTLIYMTMPTNGGIPAMVMFGAMEGVVWLIRNWEADRETDAFVRGIAYGF